MFAGDARDHAGEHDEGTGGREVANTVDQLAHRLARSRLINTEAARPAGGEGRRQEQRMLILFDLNGAFFEALRGVDRC